MIIILSQKIDTMSSYVGDELFKTYHYPARYRKQIHTGDIFVCYQGNRQDKSRRFYFGFGRIGKIEQEDEDNYYAELENAIRFEKNVPIYLSDGGYIEQFGYETVRKQPPWQSSIRPLSEAAFNYIINHSGSQRLIDNYNLQMKKAIQKYYITNDKNALLEILEVAQRLANLYHL